MFCTVPASLLECILDTVDVDEALGVHLQHRHADPLLQHEHRRVLGDTRGHMREDNFTRHTSCCVESVSMLGEMVQSDVHTSVVRLSPARRERSYK